MYICIYVYMYNIYIYIYNICIRLKSHLNQPSIATSINSPVVGE